MGRVGLAIVLALLLVLWPITATGAVAPKTDQGHTAERPSTTLKYSNSSSDTSRRISNVGDPSTGISSAKLTTSSEGNNSTIFTGVFAPQLDGQLYGETGQPLPSGKASEWADGHNRSSVLTGSDGTEVSTRVFTKTLSDNLYVGVRVEQSDVFLNASGGNTLRAVRLRLDRDDSGNLSNGDLRLTAHPKVGGAAVSWETVEVFQSGEFVAVDESRDWGTTAFQMDEGGATVESGVNRSALADVFSSESGSNVSYDITFETDGNTYDLGDDDNKYDLTGSDIGQSWTKEIPDPEIDLPRVDLGLDLEVAQGVQTEGHGLPLVRDKETLARAFVTHNKSSAVDVQVTFTASRATGSGTTVLGSRTVTFEAPAGTPDRTDIDQSANLELPASWTDEEAIFLKATVQPVRQIETSATGDSIDAEYYAFYDTHNLRIHRIRVNTNTSSSPIQVSTNNRDWVSDGLADSYPVANPQFVDVGWGVIGAQGPSVSRAGLMRDLDRYAMRKKALYTLSKRSGWVSAPPPPDQVYGLTRIRGLSDPTWGNGPQNAYAAFGSAFEVTMAHEVNHNIGNNTWSRHVNVTQSPTGANGCGAGGTDPTWNNLFNDDVVHTLGWDPGDGIIASNTGDLMTYCNPRWISDYRWKRLHDRLESFNRGEPVHPELQSSSGSGSSGLPASGKQVLGKEVPTIRVISGTLTVRDGELTGTLDPSFEQPGVLQRNVSDRRLEAPEAYLLVHRSNETVQRIDIEPRFTGVEGAQHDSSTFSVTVSDNSTVEQIDLVRAEDETLLHSLSGTNWSVQDAAIEVPSAFERGNYTEFGVTITAENGSEATLRKQLLYSPSPERMFWYPYGQSFSGTTANATFTELPGGSQARFLVLVSDGLDTHFVASPSFEVAPQPPEITIDRNDRWEATNDGEGQPPDDPATGEVVNVATRVNATVGAPVSVDATTKDQYGRSLPNSVAWNAIDTETGESVATATGQRFNHTFSRPGTYELRAQVIDPATDLVDTDTITVHVSPPPLPDQEKVEVFKAAVRNIQNTTDNESSTVVATPRNEVTNAGSPLEVAVNASTNATRNVSYLLVRVDSPYWNHSQNISCTGGSTCASTLTLMPPEHVTTWNGTGYDRMSIRITAVDDAGGTTSTRIKTALYMAGDATGDGVVNIFDASAVGRHWRGTRGTGKYSSAADLNNDGAVNLFDIVVIGRRWQETAA